MNADFLIFALREGIKTLLILIVPLLTIPMVLGLIISIFQAVTQIQDQLLNFFPKVVIIFITIAIGMPFALSVLGGYFTEILAELPKYM